MFSTIDDFCRKYGAESLSDLVVSPEHPGKKQSELAEEFRVTAACISQWEKKFCDDYRLLKPDVIDFVESHYNIQVENLQKLKALVEDQRAILRLIKGGQYGRSGAESENLSP
jgi:hypothetical protein